MSEAADIMEPSVYKRHLLVGVDDSADSERALRWAVGNLYREGDYVHIFTVMPPQQYFVISGDAAATVVTEDEQKTEELEQKTWDFMYSRFAPIVEEAKIPYKVEVVKHQADCEAIGRVICQRAAEIEATAVVLASHRKSAIKEFFMGSVTKYCTHHCTQPVLVMH